MARPARLKRGQVRGYLRSVHSPSPGSVAAHCLVVDDDAVVRRSVARIIQANGLATMEAASGPEALAILEREGEFPLIISDIDMPGMDGVTFLREALHRYPDMAVVMLSGVAEVTTAVECLTVGALDYIAKPVLVEEVRARVDALEARRRREHFGYAATIATDTREQGEIWKLRKAGLGLLFGTHGDAKPLAFVEDTAVPPKDLAKFVARFREIFARHGVEGAYYGHCSVGCLHIRPAIDIKNARGIQQVREIEIGRASCRERVYVLV